MRHIRSSSQVINLTIKASALHHFCATLFSFARSITSSFRVIWPFWLSLTVFVAVSVFRDSSPASPVCQQILQCASLSQYPTRSCSALSSCPSTSQPALYHPCPRPRHLLVKLNRLKTASWFSVCSWAPDKKTKTKKNFILWYAKSEIGLKHFN